MHKQEAGTIDKGADSKQNEMYGCKEAQEESRGMRNACRVQRVPTPNKLKKILISLNEQCKRKSTPVVDSAEIIKI
jgi:hypothetical protein